jgi:hypothetical protein
MEVDKTTIYPPNGPNSFQQLHSFLLLWQKDLHKEFCLCLVRCKLTHIEREPQLQNTHGRWDVLPLKWADWLQATLSTSLSHQIVYVAVCVWRTESNLPLVLNDASVGLCVVKKCKKKCRIPLRRIELVNKFKYELKKIVSFETTVYISLFKKVTSVKC